jgi:SagB-type dehydrogenase family enzyme
MKPAIIIRSPGGVLLVAIVVVACSGRVAACGQAPRPAAAGQAGQEIQLPKPQTDGKMSVERAIATRRSVRQFAPGALTWAEIGQLAWAGQGITDAAGIKRAAPSAGALYPMELYIFTAEGVFHYLPKTHQATRVMTGDQRPALSAAALNQESIKQAPCVIVLAAVPERTRPKYKDRTPRYIAIEAGHIGENVLLEATALGLAGVPIGAFTDEKVGAVLGLKSGEEPIYILAIGHAGQ